MNPVLRSIGPAPRTPWFQLPGKPPWMLAAPDDLLHELWSEADTIQREGVPVLGRIYMANSVLFEAGRADAPAGVVYSFDPVLQAFPRWLDDLADRMYAMHEADTSPETPWARYTQDLVWSGTKRCFHRRLPPEISGGPIVYHSTLMVFRDHLAERRLTSMEVPLIVHRDTRLALIVPTV